MNAKLLAALKNWDRSDRIAAVKAMLAAVEDGSVPQARELLEQSPLLDHFVPYQTEWWSHLAAAAGHWEMVQFWREREKTTRTASKQASLESLLFWAMGYQYVKAKGDPVKVAEHLLAAGAAVDGEMKEYTPLHRAVFMNRPAQVKLLIRREANLACRSATGKSALQIAKGNQISQECAKLLEQAKAPYELPKKRVRPKPIRTIDLRESAKKLADGIETAIRRFTRRHRNEVVTAIGLASIPHEAYVMISFDTVSSDVRPWDANYSEFAWIMFPDWRRAFQGEQMYLIDLDGQNRLKKYDEDEPLFLKMIVATLRSMQSKGDFVSLNVAKDCRIGIEMTHSGVGKSWRLSRDGETSKRRPNP